MKCVAPPHPKPSLTYGWHLIRNNMIFDKYFLLRIKKFWITKVIHWAYPDLPFEISWTSTKDWKDTMMEECPSDWKVITVFKHKNKVYVIHKK